MIKTVMRWYCTICGYGEAYDPQKVSPPSTCPACNDGKGHGSFVMEERDAGS